MNDKGQELAFPMNNIDTTVNCSTGSINAKEIVKWSYKFADEMLKQELS